MKQETLDQAKELECQIDGINKSIDRLDEMSINFNFAVNLKGNVRKEIELAFSGYKDEIKSILHNWLVTKQSELDSL